MLVASSNFLVPNATFVVELVAFLLVLGALAKYVVPILNENMERRQAVIREAIADAEEAKRRSQAAEAEYREAIDKARAEARSLLEETNRLAESVRAERRQQAEQEYERIVGRARDDINAEVRRASEELRQQIADIAIAVAEKVLGENLDAATHRSFIERTISDIENQAEHAEVSS
ncbi:MAG: F0F1 ATP synthase subunit B [Acidimicrobiales bacterium]